MADNAMEKHRAKIKAKHEREARAKANKPKPKVKKTVAIKKPAPVVKVKKPAQRKPSTIRSATARKNSAVEELFRMIK